MSNVRDIIIIGAGPAGIAAAIEAEVSGIKNILLIEKANTHSATIRKYYKDGKRVDKEWQGQTIDSEGTITFSDGTKESTIAFFDRLLSEERITAKYSQEVERVEKKDGILYVHTASDSYAAKTVIVCIGRMGKPNKPTCEIDKDALKRVHYNLDMCGKDERVLVVGGGNSAAEYAIDLADNNAVSLSYRKTEFSRLNGLNLRDINEASQNGKVELLMGTNIESIVPCGDEEVEVHFAEREPLRINRVVFAIGGSTPTDFLKKSGIEMDGNQPKLDDDMQSSIHGLFVSGDLAFRNGGSIIIALDMSYKIIQKITQEFL